MRGWEVAAADKPSTCRIRFGAKSEGFNDVIFPPDQELISYFGVSRSVGYYKYKRFLLLWILRNFGTAGTSANVFALRAKGKKLL